MNTASREAMRLAARMGDITPFHVMELMHRAQQLEAAGHSIVHMEVGEPDFPTPEPVIEAARRFLSAGHVHYTPAMGLPRLRDSITAFYATRYGVSVDPERVIVTSGASAALLLALAVLVDPGDEVLLTDPGYPCNRNFVRLFGGRPRGMNVGAETAYQPTCEQVSAAWGNRTRALLLATPANPTGTLIGDEVLSRIADGVRGHGGALLVDEIYHGLTYGTEAGTVLRYTDDAFVINSFSKYFGMTGWRLGWLIAPRPYVREIEKLAQNLYISPSAPAQHAALAAFDAGTIAILESRRAQFQARRDFLVPALRRLGFRVATEPRGAFYVYADISGIADDSHALAMRLIDEAGVAITPGLDFGENAPERHVRLAYTTSLERIEAGVERIARFLGCP
jgi:aspartate/methionine/tyrosine aminotransferase